MLIYLATGKVALTSLFIPLENQAGRIKRLKNSMSAQSVCQTSNTNYLCEFGNHVFNLEFEETPNYSYLRFLLTKNLLDRNLFPDNDFDWITKH